MHLRQFYTAVLAIVLFTSAAQADQSITQYGITWMFDKDYPVGKFVNGDYWVIGPLKIISITNDLNSKDFTPNKGQNGSMINPRGGSLQGYDDGNKKSYKEELNAALPGGKLVSGENPLELKPGQTLVSAVSWLYKNPKEREPGCPRWHTTNTPRPALRSAAVLTCLDAAPPEGSFRPPYCGDDKTVKHNFNSINRDILQNLKPVGYEPDISAFEKRTSRPWIDHVKGWSGAMYHPSENMPNYGRELSTVLMKVELLLQLDFTKLEGKPSKDRLIINIVQLGIDLAAVADTGGSWPPDGGHGLGRKLPILMAGYMLEDEHMKGMGEWKTLFQEDAQTFYVSQKEVDLTNSKEWKPDKRRKNVPYAKEDIGMAEWGIRHATRAASDAKNWSAIYRGVNNAVYPGIALAARMMGLKEAWNHDAFFDYADRVIQTDGGGTPNMGPNCFNAFGKAMWSAYRKQFD